MKRLLIAAGMLAALQAHAEEDAPRLMRVVAPAGTQVDFYDDQNSCSQGGETCRARSHAAPGEELLITMARGDWSYASSKGWIRTALLADAPVDPQPAWDGVWKAANEAVKRPGRIAIACQDGACRIDAETKWNNGTLPNGEQIENLGSMSGPLRVDGNRARFDDGNPLMPDIGCKADFVRLGRYLVAQDNRQCGGYNVRFDDVYMLDKP